MRELDVAIAEALEDVTTPAPKYSTEGNAMLELTIKMRMRGWLVVTSIKENDCTANYYKPIGDGLYNTEKMFISKADTEPLARALAAYKALTGNDWDDDYHELWVDVSTHDDKANKITRFVSAYSGNVKIEASEPIEK